MAEGRSTDTQKILSWVQHLRKVFFDPKDRKQLIELIRNASERQIVDADALSMIEGVLNVSQMQARDVMIPRSQVVMVPLNAPTDDILKLVVEKAHSRFPVINDDRDDVIGIVLAKDLLAAAVSARQFTFSLRDLIRPAIFIPESRRLNVLLKRFRTDRNHMAIVADEYGGVAGIVTIENVLEQIVGEIEDEHDDIDDEASILRLDKTTYRIKALTTIKDFNEHFDVHWDDDDFDTIGGFVMNKFGYLPGADEKIMIGRFQFTVISADRRRIRLLEMLILADTEPQA